MVGRRHPARSLGFVVRANARFLPRLALGALVPVREALRVDVVEAGDVLPLPTLVAVDHEVVVVPELADTTGSRSGRIDAALGDIIGAGIDIGFENVDVVQPPVRDDESSARLQHALWRKFYGSWGGRGGQGRSVHTGVNGGEGYSEFEAQGG